MKITEPKALKNFKDCYLLAKAHEKDSTSLGPKARRVLKYMEDKFPLTLKDIEK